MTTDDYRNAVNQWCCAMSQVSASNDSSKASIISNIELYKRSNGATTYFVIVMWPYETKLEKILLELGFKEAVEFKRRDCYNQTQVLKMYFLEPTFKRNCVVEGINNAVFPTGHKETRQTLVKPKANKIENLTPVIGRRSVGRPRKDVLLRYHRRDINGVREYYDEKNTSYTLSRSGNLYKGTILEHSTALASGTFILRNRITVKEINQ